MKTLIIRKPKFMRNDDIMLTYIKIAESIYGIVCESELSSEEQSELLDEAGKCLNKAAKAGGFFTTKDFLNWIVYRN